MGSGSVTRAEIVVDLAAIRHNAGVLRTIVAPAVVMAVVKADGYGHGLVPSGRAARDGGADWLGVATIDEGLALRQAGDRGRILSWLHLPGEDRFVEAVAHDIDVTAYSWRELEEIHRAAVSIARVARVHLKVDTGLSRGGCPVADWRELVSKARRAEEDGALRIIGVMSHFAAGDEPEHPANDAQETAFRHAVAVAAEAGLRPEVRHLASSASAILRPSSRFDLVRCGIAVYGLAAAPGRGPDLGLRPAMTVRAPLVLAKAVTAGTGVSYGHTWVADHATTLGLVPVGYGDGVPRHASSRADVWLAGRRRPVRGRICMDQFVVDLQGDLPEPGEPVTLFGPGEKGEPTAQDWAEACGTINYEIVTRVGGRMHRRYVGEETA